jgi:peptidoglycan/xylan/chitin deacetylase (PgdA/CDA1 family)
MKIKRGPMGMQAYRGVTALGALPYRIWHNTFQKTIVLLYHRVGTVPIDPHTLAISSKNFESQLAYLKKNATIITAADLHHALTTGVVPKRSVVITFDDGYEDNYTNAFPLLKKYALPATIFTTADADPDEELWIDQLMQAIDPMSKQYYELFEQLKQLPNTERVHQIQKLCYKKNVTLVMRPDYRRLNVNQLREMIASTLVTVGGHTVTHSKLSRLNVDEQKDEISRNASFVATLGDQPIIPFAYPFGSRRDFTADTIAVVKQFYPMAFVAYQGRIKKNTDLYCIPRFAVKDEDERRFSKRLRDFWGRI